MVAQWEQIVALVNGGYQDTVAAFYLFDEPYLHGITREDLTTLAERVHADLPTIPAAALMDYQVLIEPSMGASWINMTTASGRSTLDWVGYDCYDQFAPCYGRVLHTLLRSYVNADQRLIAVPWACRECSEQSKGPGNSVAQADMIHRNLNGWHSEILSDSRYVAIFAFLWGPYGEMSGASAMPLIRDRLYEMAYTFIPSSSNQVFAIEHSASSTYEPAGDDPGQNQAFAAFDRVTSNMWNAGQFPPPGHPGKQTPWIEAKFGTLTRITGIQLLPNQDVKGVTSHQVVGTVDGANYFPITTFDGVTQYGQALTWTGSTDVVAIRVSTTKSPSWVAWYDIQFSLH